MGPRDGAEILGFEHGIVRAVDQVCVRNGYSIQSARERND